MNKVYRLVSASAKTRSRMRKWRGKASWKGGSTQGQERVKYDGHFPIARMSGSGSRRGQERAAAKG